MSGLSDIFLIPRNSKIEIENASFKQQDNYVIIFLDFTFELSCDLMRISYIGSILQLVTNMEVENKN